MRTGTSVQIIWLTFFAIGCLSQSQRCPPYEVYNTCGTACEPSCDNPYPGACTKQCVIGCQCEKGYFRNKASNGCVPLNQCPATIRTTTRRPSTSRRTLRTRPTTRRTTSTPVLTACYNVNCAANRTTCAIVRSISCARPRPSYPPFPTWGGPSPYYPRPYPDYQRPVPPCPQKRMCVRKNACIDRHCPINTRCVLQEVTCIAPPCDPIAICVPSSNNNQCGKNEVYKECGLPSYCERSCSKMSTTVACPAICGPPSCQCMSGYYRDKEGRCVPQLVCYLQILIDVLMENDSSQQRSSVDYMQDEGASQEFQEWSREEIDENRPYPGPQPDPWISKRQVEDSKDLDQSDESM
ncbi:hypothetical protein WR25_01772 [Diploscapter pachys]|uniref:TIL domain-containing protein n=1 Tax=Diploscapter pachys TaxID=2018661 RepID=A0A2A2JIE1_9BILA|nr:hypothetical protein WR25_01772 [Diploscapter pachys]